MLSVANGEKRTIKLAVCVINYKFAEARKTMWALELGLGSAVPLELRISFYQRVDFCLNFSQIPNDDLTSGLSLSQFGSGGVNFVINVFDLLHSGGRDLSQVDLGGLECGGLPFPGFPWI